MTIADRVKDKRRKLGLTQTELADLIGITQQSLQKIEDGRTKNPRKLLNLSKVLDCDPEWLQFGLRDEVRELRSSYEPEPQYMNFRPKVADYQAATSPLSEESQQDGLYSPVGASNHSFWLTVVGDSMTCPSGLSVPEDYLILVEPDLTAQNGDLVLARINSSNEVTFKQFVTDAGRDYLKPLNPNYRPTEVTMNIHIIGVVIEARFVLTS